MNVYQLAGVMLGGGLGSLVRYLVTLIALEICPAYRGLGTLIVNVLGSLAIGFLAGAGDHKWLSVEFRTFLVTGVLGGLTTFSSFALESVLLGREAGTFPLALLHVTLNLVLGLAAVFLGARWALSWQI